MKLSWKMTLIFSIMMLAALFSMSMYASELTVNGANAFTKARFFSMSSSIQRSLEQDVSMMSITMQELTENTSFMAALNQMVRDDSTDQKVGTAARRAALQQLLQSPLVDKFARVSFYTRIISPLPIRNVLSTALCRRCGIMGASSAICKSAMTPRR